MSLLTPAERKTQIQRKRRAVLRWLRNYTWSHPKVLQAVLGYNTRRAVELTLQKMERDDLIKSAAINVSFSRPVRLWGLTHKGLEFAFDANEAVTTHRVFEPSKVAATTLEHDIDIQLLHVRALRVGWKTWKSAAAIAEAISPHGLNIPDAIAIRATGEPVAIEVERTIKSLKRYQELLVSHLHGRKLGLWNEILYLSPDAETAVRVERAFKSIRSGRYRGETFQVQPGHLAPFTFQTYDTFSATIHPQNS